MKFMNLKVSILIILEALLINGIGVILYTTNAVTFLDLTIFIVLLAMGICMLYFVYKKYNISSNKTIVLSFVLALLLFLACEIVYGATKLSGGYISFYFLSLGNLILLACFMIYKRNKNSKATWTLVVRFLGVVFYLLCVFAGVCNFFGLVTHS